MDIQQPDKTYKQDHPIIYSCQYHVVFCPKYRRKVLTGEIDTRLKDLILEKQDDYGYKIIDREVMPDHVHLLIDVDPRMGIVEIVGQIKGYSAHRNFCS